MELTYDRWIYVETDSMESARRFFGLPADWPGGVDRFGSRSGTKVYRLLSPAYIAQENALR